MHMVPSISSLTRVLRSSAAIPLGCLSVLVTWLNFTTVSPLSQPIGSACAACEAMARAAAVAASERYFMCLLPEDLVSCEPRKQAEMPPLKLETAQGNYW